MARTRAPAVKRPEFTAYLERFRPRQIVGRATDCEDCPVARYILNEFGLTNVEVTYGGYTHSDPRVRGRKIAMWVTNFIGAIDQIGDVTNFDEHHPVTAKQALSILAGVR